MIVCLKVMNPMGSNPFQKKQKTSKFNYIGHILNRNPFFSYGPRKKPSYFPLYWLFNRDPYNGLL